MLGKKWHMIHLKFRLAWIACTLLSWWIYCYHCNCFSAFTLLTVYSFVYISYLNVDVKFQQEQTDGLASARPCGRLFVHVVTRTVPGDRHFHSYPAVRNHYLSTATLSYLRKQCRPGCIFYNSKQTNEKLNSKSAVIYDTVALCYVW